MDTIHISTYNPQWSQIFNNLRQEIWPEIEDVALSVEHVGSTAVPGLAAKPIIDMNIIVQSPHRMKQLINILGQLNIKHKGDLGITGREVFTNINNSYPHHLYACITGCASLKNHLFIRDYLRNNHDALLEYAKLKKHLARKFPNDIDSYVEGKTAFLAKILQMSDISQAEIGQIETMNKKAK